MSKYARREIEPTVVGAVLAAEDVLDGARAEAYGAPQLNITDNTFFTGKPQTINIDRDKDGTPDAIASVDYTIFGNLDSITVKNAKTGNTEYTLNASRFLGHAMSVTGDMNGDGKNDLTVRPVKGWFSKNIARLDVDRDGDGKFEGNIDIDRGFFTRAMYSLEYDKNNDSKIDLTFGVTRGSFSGYLNTVSLEKKK